GDIAAIPVEVHHADFEQQLVTGVRFGPVGGGQVANDDAGAATVGFADAEFKEKTCARLGNHRDHRVVAQVVGTIDVGDSYGEMGAVAILVFGELEGQACHGRAVVGESGDCMPTCTSAV